MYPSFESILFCGNVISGGTYMIELDCVRYYYISLLIFHVDF